MDKNVALFYIWLALEKELVCFVLKRTLCIRIGAFAGYNIEVITTKGVIREKLASWTKGVFDFPN